MDDDLEPEESLTGPIAAKDRAASSLAKGPASKGPRGRPRLLIAAVDSQVWPSVDIRAYTLPGSQATQEFNGTSSRTKSFQLRLARIPRPSGPRAFGAEDHVPTDKAKSFPSRRDPVSIPEFPANLFDFSAKYQNFPQNQ